MQTSWLGFDFRLSHFLSSLLLVPFTYFTMKLFGVISVITAAYAGSAHGIAVSGAAEGFAKGVTGGGVSTHPLLGKHLLTYKSPQHLYIQAQSPSLSATSDPLRRKSLFWQRRKLSVPSFRILIESGSFDFTGSLGKTTSSGCSPWGTASGCQQAINKDNWCKNYQPSAPTTTIT